MIDTLLNYGLFLAKTVTFVAAIIVVIVAITAAASKAKGQASEHIEVKKINDKFKAMAESLTHEMLSKEEIKQQQKDEKAEEKAKQKQRKQALKAGKEPAEQAKPRVFVVNFDGDIRASAVTQLREEVTTILSVAKPEDEVVACVESPGGMVHNYGLAASQLARLREKNIPLTVAVDKVAASGGYMMACVANKIIAAPFAVIGSIGVIAQLPNFNRLLKKHDIDYEQITAGEYKRTLTMFGENDDKARAKFKEEIDETHALFKDFVKSNRDVVDIDAVATGEHWYGAQAIERNLVDKLQTSDDYLLEASHEKDIYEVHFVGKKTVTEKLSEAFGGAVERAVVNVLEKMSNMH